MALFLKIPLLVCSKVFCVLMLHGERSNGGKTKIPLSELMVFSNVLANGLSEVEESPEWDSASHVFRYLGLSLLTHGDFVICLWALAALEVYDIKLCKFTLFEQHVSEILSTYEIHCSHVFHGFSDLLGHVSGHVGKTLTRRATVWICAPYFGWGEQTNVRRSTFQTVGFIRSILGSFYCCPPQFWVFWVLAFDTWRNLLRAEIPWKSTGKYKTRFHVKPWQPQ